MQREYQTRSKTKGDVIPATGKLEENKSKRGRKPTQRKKSPKKSKKEEEETQKETEILERGLIYFFYRPKVEVEEVKSLNEVQRLHILLWPEAPTMAEHKDIKGKLRLIGVSKKKLPSAEKHQVMFSFIEMVSDSVDEIKKDLGPKDYQTPKTHKEHHLLPARPLGEGVYAIVKHGEHTHLAYVLEQPEELGKVQKAFGIKKEESMILSMKNPHFIEGQHAKYPKHIQEHFQGKVKKETKFTSVDLPEMLDYEGGQLLLIGASDDLVEEFGEIGEEIEELEKMDVKRMTENRLFEELHLKRKENPPQPLLQGTWK